MIEQCNQIPNGAPRQKSPARVAAGQRNGKLGAGKKSLAGKAVSAQNAFKHGYNARAFSILPTENRDYFDNLAQALFADLNPTSPRQALLAEQIVRYNWLLQRNFRLEDTGLTAEIVSQHNTRPETEPTPDTQLATWFAVDAAFNRSQTLNTIYRHRAQIQRELARIQKQLDSLKSKEASTAQGACHPPLPTFSDEMFRQELELPSEDPEPGLEKEGLAPEPDTAASPTANLEMQNPRNEGNGPPTDTSAPKPGATLRE